MDMEELQKNLEEALEQIDTLNDRYGDAKVYIGKWKIGLIILDSRKSQQNQSKLVMKSQDWRKRMQFEAWIRD